MVATINNASSAIQWAVIRKNSAFLHKRRGVTKFFSSDKFNLSGLYTGHASGLSNDAGVSVRVADDKKSLIVETKKKTGTAKPTSAVVQTKFTGGRRRVARKVHALVKGYEPKLAHDAQVRAIKLLRVIHPKKSGGKRRNRQSTA